VFSLCCRTSVELKVKKRKLDSIKENLFEKSDDLDLELKKLAKSNPDFFLSTVPCAQDQMTICLLICNFPVDWERENGFVVGSHSTELVTDSLARCIT
jgi:hypothetical protein